MTSQISRMIPLLVITLICIGAVEAGYSIIEYFLLRQPAEEQGSPDIPDEKGKKEPASGIPRDYNIILTRNLFGSHYKTDDTPAAPAVDVAANLDKSELDVVLVGTIGGSGGDNRAIILDKKTRKQDLFKEGDELKGANVKEILRGKVILEVQGREELLDMSEAATVRPAVKAQQAPPLGQQPQAGAAQPRPVQPETRVEPPAPDRGETAPAAEGAPGVLEEAAPPLETTGSEVVAPEDIAPPEAAVPEAGPEATPEILPEAAPPGEEPQASERKIVRPRIIRPYRSQ